MYHLYIVTAQHYLLVWGSLRLAQLAILEARFDLKIILLLHGCCIPNVCIPIL